MQDDFRVGAELLTFQNGIAVVESRTEDCQQETGNVDTVALKAF